MEMKISDTSRQQRRANERALFKMERSNLKRVAMIQKRPGGAAAVV